MKLSLMASNFGAGHLPAFKPLGEIGAYVRERGLYPRDGQMVQAEGGDIAGILRLSSLQQIEDRINKLAAEMREARKQLESALEQTLAIADSSSDPYEIHYMASMFMHQREVVRALVKNPRLSERTQLLIASDMELRKDREVQLGLAHNPALSANVMAKMAAYTTDSFVLHGIALNASRQAQLSHDDNGYAEICKQIALVHFDDSLSKAAIPGVRDPEALRQIANSHSTLLAADKLALIAQNPHTPDDVLEQMAQSPMARLEYALGFDLSGKARHTLAAKQQRQVASETDFAP